MQFSKQDLIKITEQACTLTERLSSKFLLNEIQENDALVNSRIKQWCQVVAQGNWEKFEQRLAWDGLDLSTVRRALGSVRIRDEQQLPTWAETLNECLKATASVTLETLEEVTSGKNRFLNLQEPLPFEEVF